MNAILDVVSRVARASYGRPVRVFGTWLCVLMFSIGGYLALGAQDLSTAESFAGEARTAEMAESEHDFVNSRTESVLVESGSADRSSVIADEFGQRVSGAEGIEGIDRVLTADSGNRVVEVVLEDVEASPTEQVAGLQATMDEVAAENPGTTLSATGPVSVQADVTQSYAESLSILEIASLPITAILLFVVFAGLVAAAVPLVTGLAVVLLAVAWSGITSWTLPADANQVSLVLLMGLALGVDYSLFFVRRVREEYETVPDADLAAGTAVSATSRSVFIAGLTTGVSVIALFFTDSRIFHSLALGMILVVVAAILASMTLLPALIRIGGTRVLHRHFGRQNSVRSGRGFWLRTVDAVIRRPLAWATGGVVLLAALAAPVSVMSLETPGTDSMPRTFESLATLDRVSEEFPLFGVTHTVVTDTGGDDEAATGHLDEIARTAATAPGFAGDVRQVQVSTDSELARVEIPVATDSIDSDEAAESLAVLRGEVIPSVPGPQPVHVGGEVAVSVDSAEVMWNDMALVLPLVVALSFVLVFLCFRNALLALISVGLNALSVVAAYGVLVVVFQFGLGAPLFGESYTGPVVTLLPLMLFVILFGLSMDYHVLILSRVREARLGGAAATDAVRHGVVNSAGPVTAAAVVMIVIFSMFAVLPTTEMKQLAVGLAAAVALDATVVRAVLLPALLTLAGDKAWPSRVTSPPRESDSAPVSREIERAHQPA